jgi:hypothetical protein
VVAKRQRKKGRIDPVIDGPGAEFSIAENLWQASLLGELFFKEVAVATICAIQDGSIFLPRNPLPKKKLS